jgi:hypothetical protein
MQPPSHSSHSSPPAVGGTHGPCGTQQRKMVLPGEALSLVLMTIEAARATIPGHDEDDIIALVEEGAILFAWNIALGESREVRLYPDSVAHFASSGGHRPFPRTDNQVICHLLAQLTGGKPFTTGKRLALLLNCSSSHITNLIQAKRLALMPGTTYGPGKDGSPLITDFSVKKFFADTRIF